MIFKGPYQLFIWLILIESYEVKGTSDQESSTATSSWLALWGNPLVGDERLKELGLYYQEKNNHEYAISCFTDAISKNSTEPQYYRLRAESYLKMKSLPLAIADFQKVVELQPDSKDDRLELSRLFYEAKRYSESVEEMLASKDDKEIELLGLKLTAQKPKRCDEAIRCFTAVIEANPDIARYYRLRGHCYREMKKYDLAATDFHKLLMIDSQLEQDHISLRQSLVRNGSVPGDIEETLSDVDREKLANEFCAAQKFDQAIRLYANAVEKNPYESRYYRQRGNLYLDIKDFKKAAADFHKAVMLDPSDDQNRDLLKRALRLHGSFDEVMEEYLIILTERELKILGDEFYYKKNYESAIRCYSEALERNRDVVQHTLHYRQRAKCYTEMSDFYSAVFDTYKTVQIDPSSGLNRDSLRRALSKLERFDEATEKMLSILDAVELETLANELFYAEKYDQAARCYTEAIEKNPNYAMYYEKRVRCYEIMGKTEHAILDMKKLVHLQPTDIQRAINLIDWLIELGRYDDAKNVVGEAEVWKMSRQNIEHLEQAYWRIDDTKRRIRLKELITYSKKLIIDEAERRIARVKEEKEENKKADDEIRKIELDRDMYLGNLKRTITAYKVPTSRFKISPFTHLQRISLLPRHVGYFIKNVPHPQKIFNYFINNPANTSSTNIIDDVCSSIFSSREMPDYMMDAITYELMTDPVIAPSGITYERSTITQILQRNRFDPMTREPLTIHQLVPNRALKEALDLWKQYEVVC